MFYTNGILILLIIVVSSFSFIVQKKMLQKKLKRDFIQQHIQLRMHSHIDGMVCSHMYARCNHQCLVCVCVCVRLKTDNVLNEIFGNGSYK